MAIDLQKLLSRAFFAADVGNASETIELAREEYEKATGAGGFSFELVAPRSPDETWVRERLLHPLVYYCDSVGAALPRCGGVFVSLFVGNKLCCVMPLEVFAWAREQLGLTPEQAEAEFGTHEQETVVR